MKACTLPVFTIQVNDGDSLEVSVTAGASETAHDVCTAFKSAIDGNAAVSAHVTTAVVGVGSAATLTIIPTTATDVFGLSDISAVVLSTSPSVESAADTLTAIQDEDADFYFVTAEDHSDTFVQAMSAAVEAQTLLYFVSSDQATSYSTAYSPASTDLLALLKQSNKERTVSMWSQVADTEYPECAFVGVNAPYSPDENAVVWSGTKVSSVLAKNSLGNALTATQEKNLFDRNANYVTNTAVGIRQLGGKSVSGEWIDNIRTRDTVIARVKEGQQSLILNQAGGKLVGGRDGVALCEARLTESLTPFTKSKALESSTTDSSDATIDQNTRTLSNMKFEGVLQGAIISIVINGTLVNATL